MCVQGGSVELIALEPQPGKGCRAGIGAIVSSAESQDRPAASGNLPTQSTIRTQPTGEIDDLGPLEFPASAGSSGYRDVEGKVGFHPFDR